MQSTCPIKINVLIQATLYLPLLLLVFLGGTASYAQRSASLEKIKQVELEKLDDGARTQLQIDDIDENRAQLVNEYQSTLKQNSQLVKYNDKLQKIITSQQEEATSTKQQIARINHLERDIVPLMSDMLDALENFIEIDIPFLHSERRNRVKSLRHLLVDANISNSEKYRRILEAYQIENDYGRTIEAYEDSIHSSNSVKQQNVTFLKIGRVAYLYQTFDQRQSYRWSAVENQWQRLDDSYNAAVYEGVKMAKEQAPSNLMRIPLSAPLTLNMN